MRVSRRRSNCRRCRACSSGRGQGRCVLVERLPLQPCAFGGFGPRRGGQVIEQTGGVRLLGFDERVEKGGAFGFLACCVPSHELTSRRVIAAPACTRTRSFAWTSPRIVVSTHSSPLAVRTNACPVASAGSSRTSASRPSSLHV